MPKRSGRKSAGRPRDLNELALLIVSEVTAEPVTMPVEDTVVAVEVDQAQLVDGKNPAAVALGRLGGLTGGKARMAKLSAEERSELARKAAQARWSVPREQGQDKTKASPESWSGASGR